MDHQAASDVPESGDGYHVSDGLLFCTRCQTVLDLDRDGDTGMIVLTCWLCGGRHYLDQATTRRLEVALRTHWLMADFRKRDDGTKGAVHGGGSA